MKMKNLNNCRHNVSMSMVAKFATALSILFLFLLYNSRDMWYRYSIEHYSWLLLFYLYLLFAIWYSIQHHCRLHSSIWFWHLLGNLCKNLWRTYVSQRCYVLLDVLVMFYWNLIRYSIYITCSHYLWLRYHH